MPSAENPPPYSLHSTSVPAYYGGSQRGDTEEFEMDTFVPFSESSHSSYSGGEEEMEDQGVQYNKATKTTGREYVASSVLNIICLQREFHIANSLQGFL